MMKIRSSSWLSSGLPALLMLLFVFFYVAWLLRGQDLTQERYWIGGLTLIFSSGLAAFLSWRAYQKTSLPAQKKGWLWLSIGLGLWFFLDAVNVVWLIHQQPDLFSSLSHVLHFAAGLSAGFGVISFSRTQRAVLSRSGLFLDLGLTFSALSLLLWDAWFLPLFSLHAAFKTTALVFIVVDILALIFLLLLFLITKAEAIPGAFGWVFLAILCFSISDMNYLTINSSQGQYSPGTVMDLGWVMGNLFIAVAILTYTRPAPRQRPEFVTRVIARSQSLLPILSILLLGWYAILIWQFNGVFDAPILWGTLILGLGLLLRQGIQAGESAMEQYAHLVNSIAEPAFVIDDCGKMQLVNHAFLEISQIPLSRLVGSTIDQLFVMSAEDQNWLKVLFNSPRIKNKVDFSREVELKTSGEALIPVLMTLRSIETGNRKHLAYAATAHDLRLQKQQQAELLQAYEQVAHARTELELLNAGLERLVNEKTGDLLSAYQTLAEQNKALQELDQIKSDFVSLVSHELRAPLTNIRGGIELLLTAPISEPAKTYNILQRVQSEILRLSTFTETILDLSAMDANRLPLYLEPIDLNTVSSDLQQFFSQTLSSERINWDVHPANSILLADKKALHSVLFHLIDNALKYAPQGEIQVTTVEKEDALCIQILDFGPGIAPSAIPHIFDQFYRGDMTDAQTVYGHGLGLYMVKRFVDAMNGSVQVESRQPHGAAFTVILPLVTSLPK
jgi:PAS domain S-box-containing protein